MAKGPAQRSMDWLRKRGWYVWKCEHWNPWARVRIDLAGFIDVIAIHPDEPRIFAIQATTTSNQSKRIAKILASMDARLWLRAGTAIHVHGWRKSKRTRRWELTETPVTLEDFNTLTIKDGHGGEWSAWCPECGRKSVAVVRPGKAQCEHCG